MLLDGLWLLLLRLAKDPTGELICHHAEHLPKHARLGFVCALASGGRKGLVTLDEVRLVLLRGREERLRLI